MDLTMSRRIALPRKSRVQKYLPALHPTVLVLTGSLFHPRSSLPLVEQQLALELLLLLLLLPVLELELLLDRATFTVCKWISFPQRMTNWNSALALWFGCFMSMMMDG
jgi:hypothetical protein